MDINTFKDLLFDIINDSDLPITSIDMDDANNILKITTTDQSEFVLTASKLK